MAPIEEQLYQLRKAIVEKRLKDVPQSTLERQLRYLKHMNFGSVAEFEEWVNETATDYNASGGSSNNDDNNEVSPMMKEYISDRNQRTARKASQSELDDVFKHMGI